MNWVLEWLISSVQSVDGLMRDVFAGLAILLETSLFVGLIVPGDTVVLVAATGVTDFADALGLVGFVLLGSLIGESTGFWVGRFFGERIRASKLGQKLGAGVWNMADSFVETRGGPAVAISRFLPFLHEAGKRLKQRQVQHRLVCAAKHCRQTLHTQLRLAAGIQHVKDQRRPPLDLCTLKHRCEERKRLERQCIRIGWHRGLVPAPNRRQRPIDWCGRVAECDQRTHTGLPQPARCFAAPRRCDSGIRWQSQHGRECGRSAQ
jgi:membrane protein YqaA with SNARE-associated domain